MGTEEEILSRLKPGCICKGIKLYKIIQAIEEGGDTYGKIAEKTGIGGGSCDSKRCFEKVTTLLADMKQTRMQNKKNA